MQTSRILILLATCCTLAAPVAVHAQSENPAWLDELARQIADQEQCEVGFYIFIDEQKLGGRETLQAKLQCVDGRQFDASRVEPATEFEISECGTRVC
ncbi:hypothetical protein [Aquibium oceanicum]|uniref:Uncharacterized protein n=1 Tax=Aquibium oceanicum TaxID=1670800 RepID=A0A1L3STT0_9HYPH|nr:hypothetical protein [Aquibium oceanicum]APH72712.1 hypothetical protein BSQ44_16095 [Aquibium oceanicum]